MVLAGAFMQHVIPAPSTEERTVRRALTVSTQFKSGRGERYSFETVLLPLFTTQMLAPSKATPYG